MPAEYEEQHQRTDAPSTAAPAPAAAPASLDFAAISASVHGNRHVSRQLSKNGGHAFRPGLGTGLALARATGNPAGIASAAARTGAPLPSSASAASSMLGSTAADVRVHHGAAADAKLSSRPGALAVTEGTDIHVGSDAPALDTPPGQLLIAHEAAHVLQQTKAGPAHAAGEHTEQEADDAAVAASLGAPVGQLSAARGPQFFEAPKHSASLKTAMDKHGLTDAEQDAAYFGNWCRDLSQALVPTLTDILGQNLTFQVVNAMAIRHFGHGVTPAQLGAYDPRQHIDNPAGTTDRDIVSADKRKIAGYEGKDPILKDQESGEAGTTSGEELKPENIAKSFEVDSAGVPGYIKRSKDYIVEEYDKAAEKGRTEEGLFHLGNFSHTCEDLFAHSNWVEMAVGKLIKDGTLQVDLPPDVKSDVDARIKAGRPPVEDYAAEVTDKHNQARPVLATGTFTGGSATGAGAMAGHDTIISLSEEAKNLIKEMNPFAEKAEGGATEVDFGLELLKHADAAGDEGQLGTIVSECLDPLYGVIDEQAKKLTGSVDSLKGQGTKAVGDNWAGKALDWGANKLSQGAHAAVDPLAEMGTKGAKALVKGVVDEFGKTSISLAEIALYIKKGTGAVAKTWESLKKGVRELPEKLRELIMPELIAAEKKFKKKVRELGTALYEKATDSIVNKLTQIKKASNTKETNVDHKMEVWAQELKQFILGKYKEVGGPDGAKLGGELPDVPPRENIPTVIKYAGEAFPATLADLAAAAGQDAKLTAKALEKGDSALQQLKQLSEVPEWARAGASHSQIAKDHSTSPFFGLAFQLAQAADTKLVGILKAAWGNAGPEAKLDKNYGERYEKDETDEKGNVHKKGEQKVDENGKPVLKENPGENLSDWEKDVRKKFLENRMQGEHAVKHGEWEHPSIGPSLVAIAAAFEEKTRKKPVLGKIFGALIDKMRKDAEPGDLTAAIAAAYSEWEAYASAGKFDDDVMAGEIDNLLLRAKGIAETFNKMHEGHHHEGGDQHKHSHDGGACDHSHCDHEGGYCAEGHEPDKHNACKHEQGTCSDEPSSGEKHGPNETGGDVHTKEQIDKLDKYRGGHKPTGVDPATGKPLAGPEVERLNTEMAYDKKKKKYAATELDKKADAAAAGKPREQFMAELDRIFGHPYDTNWWVGIVQAWAAAHKVELAQHIKDRNSGKAHVH